VIVTHDKDLLRRLAPRVVMLHGGSVHFDGPYGEFEASDSPAIRPYLEAMPILHRDLSRAVPV
jgi:phospholipid/cholesterol/gamma-HCH transport system ATP-binding protein